jgi:hypothetical protein
MQIAAEVEDHRFNASAARAIRDYEPKDYWALLARVAKKSFSASSTLRCNPNEAARRVAPYKGTASLGCLLPVESLQCQP